VILAAAMLGVLRDGRGVRCPTCRGQCSDNDANCEECDGQGRIYPGQLDLQQIDPQDDYALAVQLIYASRERPLLPTEILSQPANYVAAYRFLAEYLFGELDERREALSGRE
jgi:hypothetical protein